MARKKFNLDSQALDGFTMMVHGGRAAGKTHLMGDFLAHEKAKGHIRFINVLGEDGTLTISGMGLGAIAETVESYEDFLAACKEYQDSGVHAVALDSLSVLGRWVCKKVLGGADRAPRISKEGNEWGDFHREMDIAMLRLRQAARYVLCACPSDKSADQLTGITYISPDLPGRQAVGSAGWFDFVGFLKADVVGPKKIERKLVIAPNSTIVVRQRLPKQIVEDIVLPDGPGGWAKIKQAYINHGAGGSL